MDHNSNSSQHNFIQVNEPAAHAFLLNFIGLSEGEAKSSDGSQASTDVLMPLLVLAQSPDYREQWSDGLPVQISQN